MLQSFRAGIALLAFCSHFEEYTVDRPRLQSYTMSEVAKDSAGSKSNKVEKRDKSRSPKESPVKGKMGDDGIGKPVSPTVEPKSFSEPVWDPKSFMAEIKASLATNHTGTATQIAGMETNLLAKLDAKLEAKMAPLEKRIDDLQSELESVKSSIAGSSAGSGFSRAATPRPRAWADVVAARTTSPGGSVFDLPDAGFATAGGDPPGQEPVFGLQPPTAPPGPIFNRPIEPDIIKISCKQLFTLEEATKATKKLLEDAGLNPSAGKVEGGKVNNRFVVRFAAGPKAVQQVLEGQRISRTEWAKQEVVTVDRNTCPIYINPDKNAQTTRTEIALKQVVGILRAKYDPAQFPFQIPSKQEGIITLNWKKLCRVQAIDASTTRILWWGDEWERKGIDKRHVETEFEAVNGSAGGGSWA